MSNKPIWILLLINIGCIALNIRNMLVQQWNSPIWIGLLVAVIINICAVILLVISILERRKSIQNEKTNHTRRNNL